MVNAAHNRHGRVDFFDKNHYKEKIVLVSTAMERAAVDALVIFRQASFTNPYLVWLAGKYESSDPYTFIIKHGALIEVDDRPGGPADGSPWPPRGAGNGGPPKPPPGAPEPEQGEKGPHISPFLQPGADKNIKKQLSGLRRIAFVGLGEVDAQFIHLLADIAPDAELIDFTAELDALRLQRNQAELDAVREAVYVQEKALESVPNLLRRAVYQRDLAAEILGVLRRYGSDFCGGACPLASVVHIDRLDTSEPSGNWPGPRLDPCGVYSISIYGHGAGGFKARTARTAAIQPPPPEFLKANTACGDLEEQFLQMLKPGVQVEDALERFHIDANRRGMKITAGVWPIDVELHDFQPGTQLDENMTVTVEVVLVQNDITVRLQDTCVIAAEGAVRLGGLPNDMIFLEERMDLK